MSITRQPALATVALGVALVLGACRLDVAGEVEVAADGSGTLQMAVEMDRNTAEQLVAGGADLVPEDVAGWTIDEQVDDDGHRITMVGEFGSPAELEELVADLGRGLDDEDPHLLEDLDLTVDPDGAARLEVTAGLVVPSSAGARVTGWPTAGELVAMARAGDVTATLVVRFPGNVDEANATLVDGRRAMWQLPVGNTMPVTATASAPSTWSRTWVRWTVAVVGVVVLVAVVMGWRRRRREQTSAPLGRIDRVHRR